MYVPDFPLTDFDNRSGSSDAPLKVSPRAVRQLNTTALESKSASSSNQTCRTPKDKSPKVIDRRSPRSPVSEVLDTVELTDCVYIYII